MKKQEELEIWKDIPGFEGYQVSNLGRVKSLAREVLRCGKYQYTSKEKILTCHINTGGYYQISLRTGNNRYSKTVHTLMSRAFLNHIPDGTHKIVVDHINGIRSDNRLENLQLITNRENSSKDRKNGTSKYTGVYWCKIKNKFSAKIRVNGKQTHLGLFTCELEAHNAYQNKLKEIQNEG